MLKLGIVGLPNVGKSTLFNALTAAGADAANYPFCTVEPNVGMVEVPDPRVDLIAEGFPEDILGLFTGSPHGMELEVANPELPQIVLYLGNVWDFAEENVQAFRDEIRVTYLHELGHYLGWDEDDLTSRGLD